MYLNLNKRKLNFRYQISKFILFKPNLCCTGNIHTRVQPVLTQNTKILSKKACDATLGKPNRSFVAFSDNIVILWIRTF